MQATQSQASLSSSFPFLSKSVKLRRIVHQNHLARLLRDRPFLDEIEERGIVGFADGSGGIGPVLPPTPPLRPCPDKPRRPRLPAAEPRAPPLQSGERAG